MVYPLTVFCLPTLVCLASIMYLLPKIDKLESLAAKSKVIRGCPVEKRPDSERCFQQIQEWTRECITEHGTSCPVPKESRLRHRCESRCQDYEQAEAILDTIGQLIRAFKEDNIR